jgi:hypothetical protein
MIDPRRTYVRKFGRIFHYRYYDEDIAKCNNKKAESMNAFVKEIHGRKFRANAEDALRPQIQTLFQVIETIPIEKIKDSFRLEMGWTVFSIIEKSARDFCIAVPDYTKDPFTDITDDLTVALWVQSEQTHFLREYGITGEAVRFSDKITVANAALKKSKINLQRFADHSIGDSGWCIESTSDGAAGDAADHYEAFYAYQLLALRPALVKVLALPCEYIVVFDDDTVKAILDPFDHNIFNDSGTE